MVPTFAVEFRNWVTVALGVGETSGAAREF